MNFISLEGFVKLGAKTNYSKFSISRSFKCPPHRKIWSNELLATCETISSQVLKSVRASGIERLQCCIMQTDITSNTFDVRIIVLFLYLMTNDLLL